MHANHQRPSKFFFSLIHLYVFPYQKNHTLTLPRSCLLTTKEGLTGALLTFPSDRNQYYFFQKGGGIDICSQRDIYIYTLKLSIYHIDMVSSIQAYMQVLVVDVIVESNPRLVSFTKRNNRHCLDCDSDQFEM